MARLRSLENASCQLTVVARRKKTNVRLGVFTQMGDAPECAGTVAAIVGLGSNHAGRILDIACLSSLCSGVAHTANAPMPSAPSVCSAKPSPKGVRARQT